jgi:putative alpha-1,2-mannosidase
LHRGKKFSIKAEGLAENCFYIQSARLNGKPLNASRLRYEDIINGGELVYQMGSTPNEKWGLD